MPLLQENVFIDASSSTRCSILRHPAGASTLPQRIESPVDGDSDSSADDGKRCFYENFSAEDARSVIGVRTDHAQARLTSLLVEKVMNANGQSGEDSEGIEKLSEESPAERELDRETLTEMAAEPKKLHDLPCGKQQDTLQAPWHGSPKQFQRSDPSKGALREFSVSTRPRSSSGRTGSGSKRFFPFSLQSIPKSPSLSSSSFPGVSSPLTFLSIHRANSGSDGSRTKARKPGIFFNDSAVSMVSTDGVVGPYYNQPEPSRHPGMGASAEVGGSPTKSSLTQLAPTVSRVTVDQRLDVPSTTHGSQERPRPLRRATSDNSLSLSHSLSRVSSLGDDNRFESIHSQVNSRFKAIKDSFQDSNFNLPSLPSISISKYLWHSEMLSSAGPPRGLKADGSIKKRKSVATPPLTMMQVKSSEIPDTRSDSRTNSVNIPRSSDNGTDRWLLNALEKLTGDVVIMGGYRGSRLRSAKPPHRRVWIPIKVGLNLRKVDLEVGLGPEDEENMEETIVPEGMLTHIGPVDISRRLIKRLRECKNARSGRLRVWEYGYDWRLSPHLLSRKLTKFIEGLPSNACGLPHTERGALVIAHSLGGLITRHAVNKRPELFSGVIFAGTPQSCVNILGPLRNGDDVLLSSRVLTAQVNFTVRTSFVLLPEDGRCFIDKRTKEEYPVDFFNVESWIEYCFSPCIASPLPPLGFAGSSLGGLVGSVSGSLSGLPSSLKIRRDSSLERLGRSTLKNIKVTNDVANSARVADSVKDQTLAPHTGSQTHPAAWGNNSNNSASTTVTISREEAIAYLRRTLAETLCFKQELHFRPEHAKNNAYPPLAVIYGKSIPTVCGARVLGRDGIMRADAYDDLAFASGDGVCLAREAMLPKDYGVVKNGRVSSDRGHVTLLGDLQSVGKCITAILKGRERGIGCGVE